jgi:hypothetical protein
MKKKERKERNNFKRVKNESLKWLRKKAGLIIQNEI